MDDTIGYSSSWDIRLLRLQDGNVIGKANFQGSAPPLVKTGIGDAFGEPPAGAFQTWLLCDQPSSEVKALCLPGTLMHFAFSPDGKWIAAVNFAEQVYVWEASTGKLYHTLSGEKNRFLKQVVFSPDSKWLASVSSSGGQKLHVTIWDINTRRLLRTIVTQPESVFSANPLAFLPDGKSFTLGSAIYSATDGSQVQSLCVDTCDIMIYLPNRDLFVTNDMMNKIILWSRQPLGQSGRLPSPYELPSAFTASTTTYSIDEKSLVAGDGMNAVLVWDIPARKLLYQLRGHRQIITALAISPDNKLLASGGYENSVIIWSLSSGKALCTLSDLESWIYSLSFSPDGQRLAVGASTMIFLYDVESLCVK